MPYYQFVHLQVLYALFLTTSTSKSLREKAQLMYEIGGWYYRQHNDEEADIWILKAMNAEGASKHTVIWSNI